MKFRFWLTCILWLSALPFVSADPIKKALKSYQKQEYETTEKLLLKSLAKDSLNPGAKYTYSLLYSNQNFSRFHIDSAHYFILAAATDYHQLDEKQLGRLTKIPLDESTFRQQSNYVDSLAFDRANSQDSLGAYIYFIDQYPEASQLSQAILRRDQLAFLKAEEINTYQSFLEFIQQYPEAQQLPEAQKQYDRLLFQDQVGGGRLEDYVKFITKYPLSPYRSEAEIKIFEISTTDGLPSSFLKHLQDYPKSSSNRQARNMLFHLVKEQTSHKVWSHPNWMNDSLQTIMGLDSLTLFPIYDNGKYGFAQTTGQLVMPPIYDSLDQKYLCGNIQDDLLLVYKDQIPHWVTRTGATWVKGDFKEIQDIGFGFLKAKKDDRFGLWHKSGQQILDIVYQDVNLLKGRFITFQKDGLWGLASLTGRVLFEPLYPLIRYEGSLLTIQNESLIAVVTPDQLAVADREPLLLDFAFEEIEWIDENHLRGYFQDKEGLISDKFNIPLGPHKIYDSYQGWYAESNNGIRIFNDKLDIESIYEDLISGPFWLGLKKDGRWQVYDTALVQVTEHVYDSAALLGNQMLYLIKADSAFVKFKSGQLKLLKSGDKITLWPGSMEGLEGAFDDLLLITSDRGWRRVYNNRGQMIYRTQYYNLRRLSGDYFEIERNGRKGLVDLNGKMVLEARYDGQSSEPGNGISLLNRGRFGLFTNHKNLIKPQYQSKLKLLAPDLFVAVKNGRKGLINGKNKTQLPFDFDHIEPWNDSTFLLKEGSSWQLYNLIKGENVDEDILHLEWIKKTKVEKVIIYKKETGYGVRSNLQNEIIAPSYDDIINLGSPKEPMYFTEKRVPEAGYYIVQYYDQQGVVKRKQVFDEKVYDKILCY